MSFRILPDEPEKKESKLAKIGQIAKEPFIGAAKTTARAVEHSLGLPGDILSLLNRFVAGPVTEKITGQKALPYEETLIGKALPTTATHRKNIQSVTGKALEPRNKFEEIRDDVVQDTIDFMIPIKGKVPFKQTLTRALATSVGSNLTGEAIEAYTGSKKKGAVAKIGSAFLLTLLDKKKATSLASDLYKQAESAIPTNATTSAAPLAQTLNNLVSKMSRGIVAPSEKFVIDIAKRVQKKIQNGRININEAWAAKRGVNEELEKILLETPGKQAQHRARTHAKAVTHALNDTLESYGRTNPAFYKPFQAAEESFATIAKSNFISRFVENNLKYSPLTSGLLHLFAGGVGPSTSALVAPYAAGKLLYRLKSPTLRKMYADTLKEAAKENAVGFNNKLKKLDQAFQKEEQKGKFRIID
jgi:hypothetical protein